MCGVRACCDEAGHFGGLFGSEELLPLSLKQIALFTGVSESTVSRIVRFKYLQLPNRNIPLSSLLEKKVTIRSSGGKEISPIQLTKLIVIQLAMQFL